MDDDDRVVVVEEEEEEELIFEAEDEGMEEDEEEKRTVKAVVVEENVVEVNNEDLEEGEVSEPEPEVSKNTGRTLRVHLPDLLQGIDGNDDIPMNLDTIEKLDRRAKRFNTTNPMPADEVCKVYDSLGIPVEERERRNTGNFRLEYILMYGVFSLSDEDILEYFEEFSPMEVLDLGEDSCIVKFRNCLTSLKAMMELSKPIGEPKKEERIVKHVLTADDEPERRVVTRDIKNKLDGLVHPDDIPLEEMPEGKWRLGNYHKKSDAILLRFPSSKDFKPAHLRHHLSNDKYRPRNTYIPEIEPPVEAKEKEKELEEKKKNFDKKNPWGDIAEEWIAGTGRQREYPIGLEDLENPPRRFALGMQDWDAPQDDSQPIRIYAPASRKRKIFERLDYDGRESPEESKTYFSDGVEESEDEMQWKGKLKKPRMGMVADMEEKKNKLDVKSRLKTGGSVDKRVLKRQVSNTKFVVREEIIEEYLDDEEEEEENELLVKEARNLDLRQTLTMKIENKPIRQKIQPTKSFSDRFEGGRSKRDNLELDDGEDLPDIEDMKIEIRQYSSDEDGMDVDDNEVERERIKRLRMKDTVGKGDLRASMRGGDLRDRMRGKRMERKEDEVEVRRERREERTDTRRDERRDEVRVKKEKDGEQRKESKNRIEKKERKDEQKLIEERVREIEALKKQERKLLEEKERKLKEMEKKREEDRLKQKREKERERERERREREREKERIERERQKAKEKLREKERSRKSRRKSESSDSDSSDSGDSSSDDSDSESESSSSSSSDESDSSDSESESSSSESETERKRGKHSSSRSSKKSVKKEPEKKKSLKAEPSRKGKESKVSSKSSGKGDTADDSKKALELRDKLKNYLKKAKEAKDENDKK